MPPLILAIDQGTTSTRAILFRPDTSIAGVGAAGVRAALPGLRLGRARPRGPLAHDGRDLPDGAAGSRSSGLRRRRHRHHQPARDHGGVGPRHRRGGASRHRLAGPAHGRPLRSAEGGRARARGDAQGPASSSTPISPAPRSPGSWTTCPAPARRAERGRARLRHRRCLPALAPHRRRRPRDGRDQRLAHPAVQHPRGRLGRRAAAPARRARAPSCPRSATAPAISATTLPDLFGGRHPDPRRRRRPAGGDRRPGLLPARHAEVDLRHRLLRPAQHRAKRR